MLSGDPNELLSLSELRELVARHRPKNPVPQQVSKVARYKPRIEQMPEAGAQPQAIYDRLRVRDPVFRGSLSAIKRICARIRRKKGVSAGQAVIPVPTFLLERLIACL